MTNSFNDNAGFSDADFTSIEATVSENIRTMMYICKMSYSELANIMDMPTSMVKNKADNNQWETKEIQHLANYLGIEPERFHGNYGFLEPWVYDIRQQLDLES